METCFGMGSDTQMGGCAEVFKTGARAHDSLLQATTNLGVLTAGSTLVAACCLWKKARFMWRRSCRYVHPLL